MTLVFQPVFDLSTGQVFSAEALSRFAGPPRRTPDLWFAEAHAVDLGIELELLAVQAALAALSGLPRDVALCVNAGPDVIASGDVLQLVTKTDSRRVVIELTEQVKVDDYPHLLGAIKRLRLMGARLAIDDGCRLRQVSLDILKLDPDLIKLDRDLRAASTGIPSAGARLRPRDVCCAHRRETIAEGIENAAELDVLRVLRHQVRPGLLPRSTHVGRVDQLAAHRPDPLPTRCRSLRFGRGELLVVSARDEFGPPCSSDSEEDGRIGTRRRRPDGLEARADRGTRSADVERAKDVLFGGVGFDLLVDHQDGGLQKSFSSPRPARPARSPSWRTRKRRDRSKACISSSSDLDAARAELDRRGADPSEIFHFEAGG